MLFFMRCHILCPIGTPLSRRTHVCNFTLKLEYQRLIIQNDPKTEIHPSTNRMIANDDKLCYIFQLAIKTRAVEVCQGIYEAYNAVLHDRV